MFDILCLKNHKWTSKLLHKWSEHKSSSLGVKNAGLTDDKSVSTYTHALHIVHDAPRVTLHKAPLMWYYSTCLHCCLLTEGCGRHSNMQGRISELSSRFTSSCLTQRLAAWHPHAPCRALSTTSESPCRTVVLGNANQRQQGKSVRCHVASCLSLCSSNQESQRVALLRRQHGWHFLQLCTKAFYRERVRDGMRGRRRGWMRGEEKGLASKCVLSLLWNCCSVCMCVSAVLVSRALLLKRTDVELNSFKQLFIFMFCIPINLLLCNAVPLFSKYLHAAHIRHNSWCTVCNVITQNCSQLGEGDASDIFCMIV